MQPLTIFRQGDVITLPAAQLEAFLLAVGRESAQQALAQHSEKVAKEEEDEAMLSTDEALEFLGITSADHLGRIFKEAIRKDKLKPEKDRAGFYYEKGTPNRYPRKCLKLLRKVKGSS